MNEFYIAQRTKKLARQYGIEKISIALDCMANKGNDAIFLKMCPREITMQ